MEPYLSIIIVNWNTRELLHACLESVYQHLSGVNVFEVFVVDNGSADGSAAMVHDNYPKVHLIANTENLGFVEANNQASRLASGKYLLILNSDTEIRSSGLWEILGYMDQHKHVGIATGWMEYGDGEFQPPYRRLPTLRTLFGVQTIGRLKAGLVLGRSKLRCEDLDPRAVQEVDWVTGAYLFMRRDLLDNGNVFDRRIFMYSEDLLLCYRVRQLGYKIMYLPFGSVVHFCGKSAVQVRPTAILYSFRGSVIYVESVKNAGVARSYRRAVRAMWWLILIMLYPANIVSNSRIKEKIDLFRFLLREDKDS